MISVFQIYFDEKSYGFMDPAFMPYQNPVRDEFFENSVIREIYEKHYVATQYLKYVGVTSWKQQSKSHLTGAEILQYIQKDIDNGTEKDIYIYSPLQGIDPRWKEDNKYHGTIRQPNCWDGHKDRYIQIDTDNRLLNASGVLPFDLFDGKWQYCYCNYWIAKPHVYDDYCKNVLIPAMDFFNRPEVMAALPKWYEHRHEGRKTTSICFTLEGLFGSFMAHRDYSFDYMCKKKISGRGLRKMVTVDGYEMTAI